MRVTQGMLSNNTLRNLSNSYSNLGKYMDQLSTGKKINRPSDDPVVAMNGMNYRSQTNEVKQYLRNTNEVHNWMDNSDAALDKASQALQRIRELAVQASNGTYDAEERQNIKEEVAQLKEHIIDIANTKVNDKYLFNGTKTDEPLIGENEEGIAFDHSPVMIEVANGTKLQANVDPASIFNSTFVDEDGNEVASNLFDDIDQFIKALEDDDQNSIQTSMARIDDNINNVINARADLGARMNRLDLVENRLQQQEIVATQMMSKNEDIDYEKVITELITQESVHRAALSAGSKIIQPTLLDFLR
ncbi:flagellar hook-associated protein FlgL [Ornithinibacillus halophilus]|uniref:Flagellar hook-associated protein 3 FlgL n=1 Tax=Ornithinibacillus halophilus TaxID=930117 RepID=A0A1M5FCB2_9BACI|nr:flagellar hook-associated protein FlgL [Ornithinibacillus halophilus]SHF89240.1 flagellar hook-associated protein 3 FlgL [Ornithinibacillus halophilus]